MVRDLDLAPIKQRMEAATPEPWLDLYGQDAACPDKYTPYMIRSTKHTDSEAVIQASRYNGAPWCLIQDRIFIVHARTDVPALVAELERLRAERGAVAEAMQRVCSAADEYLPTDTRAAMRREGPEVSISATWELMEALDALAVVKGTEPNKIKARCQEGDRRG